MINKSRVFGLLGLAAKAGKVQSGEFSTEKSVKSGRAYLVIVSEEASENTKKKFRNMRSPILNSEARRSWATPPAGRCVLPWLCRTQAFPRP